MNLSLDLESDRGLKLDLQGGGSRNLVLESKVDKERTQDQRSSLKASSERVDVLGKFFIGSTVFNNRLGEEQ